MNERYHAIEFSNKLLEHAINKQDQWKAITETLEVDEALRLVVEELGETAIEITKKDWQAAHNECMDLAHTAMLLQYTIERIYGSAIYQLVDNDLPF